MLRYLSLGPAEIPTWYLAHSLAMLVSGQYAYLRLVRAGVVPRIATAAIVITAGGAAGALYLVRWAMTLAHRSGWLAHPAEAAGGGGVILVLAGGLLGQAWWKWNRLPAPRMWDLLIVPVPLAQAIGRVGCLLAGCCHGRATDSPLGLVLPDPAGWVANRWPTQLLSLVGNLAIFATLVLLERREERRREAGLGLLPPGTLAGLYLALYATKRFGVEFLRASWHPVAGPFSAIQLAAAAVAILAAVVVVVGIRRRDRRDEGRLGSEGQRR